MRLLTCIAVSAIALHAWAGSAFQTEGRACPIRILDILPYTDGIITKINFADGAYVSKGDVLFELDDRQQLAQVESFKAELHSAQVEVDRTGLLYKRMSNSDIRGITGLELDEAKSAYMASKYNLNRITALLEMAEDELSKRRIVAPFSGKLGVCVVSVGSFVATYREPLARLLQMDPIRIIFDFPVEKRRQAHMAKAQLQFADMTRYDHDGVVDFENNETDESGDSIIVGATFPNPDRKLFPGMKVILRIDSLLDPPCAGGGGL